MTQNNLEINNTDKIVEDIIKKSADKNIPMDDRDREGYIKILNERLEQIQKEISKLEDENNDLENKRLSLDGKFDENDDDKAETDKKIKRLEEQIAADNIDRDDKNNPVVKRLNSALEERDALDELTSSYQENEKQISEKQEENTNTISELKDELKLIEEAKYNINNKMMTSKISDASERAKEKAKYNTSKEKDPFLVLLESLFKRYENIKERDKLLNSAISKENGTQEKIEARYATSDSNGENIIKENKTDKVSDDFNGCMSVVISDKTNNSTQVKILSFEEYVNATSTKEFNDIRNRIKQEEKLTDSEKNISFVVSRHENKSDLLAKLQPFMKSGIENPQNIGQYATSQTRKNLLISTIADDAKETTRIGGTALDDHFRIGKAESQLTTNHAKQQQPNLHIQSADIGDNKAQKIEKDDIPWHHLKNFNLTKESLSKENIEALRSGGVTDVISIKGKNKKGMEVTESFKLKLTNDLDGNLTFEKRPMLSVKNIDNRKRIGDIEFTKEDKEMLKKYGQLNHLVPFTSEDGKTKNMMVGLDRDTNTLFKCDPDKVRLPKFISEQCTKDELRKIRNCEPVHLENLKDNAGQKFNGWVLMSPHRNGQILQLKHIDNDFKPQVRNNNFGERTEELKEDKDAMVMTKQHKSNDGDPKIETSHRKALDFSVDSNGQKTEHNKTIKRTKHF